MNNNSNLTLNVPPATCPRCGGLGVIGYDPCLACGGSGLEMPSAQPGVTANANFDPDDGLPLPTMNWDPDQPTMKELPTKIACPDCRGTGFIGIRTCPRCKGEGLIDAEPTTLPDPQSPGDFIPASNCNCADDDGLPLPVMKW